MDSPQKMDVKAWQDSPLPVVYRTRARRHVLPPTLIGILGTLLLHGMLIETANFATGGSKPKPPESDESANIFSRATADTDNLISILLPAIGSSGIAARQSAIASLQNLTRVKIKPTIDVDQPAIRTLETLALSEDQGSTPNAGGADGAQIAQLFGIYTGQIHARIDRVWRRPRTPVSENAASEKPINTEESFQCEAQIVQDQRGNVQEVLLPRCNGSSAWQRSLVMAIQQASPLPAPPSVKVFSQSITLEFVGLPYFQGASNEEYEILPAARVD